MLGRTFSKMTKGLGRSTVNNLQSRMASLDSEFAQAKERLNSLKEDPGNEAKLKIYGLFKQATVGKCNAPKPGMTDFVGKAKWNAWNGIGDISKEAAMKQYIDYINQLAGAQVSESEGAKEDIDQSAPILVEKVGKIMRITINRPDKRNSLTPDMYNAISAGLRKAAEDDSVSITVLTAAGNFFSSGNDLGNFLKSDLDPPTLAEASRQLLVGYVSAYIDHPKPLIALINGPAIGISVTVLGLVDVVLATDKATFHTPFSSLGQSPEGCSSYTFPRIMGTSKAAEFLLFGRKLTTEEACRRGLVTEVIPDAVFREETEKRVLEMSKLPPQSMRLSKQLIRGFDKATLHAVNEQECLLLKDRWLSDECMNAIQQFFSQKKSKM